MERAGGLKEPKPFGSSWVAECKKRGGGVGIRMEEEKK